MKISNESVTVIIPTYNGEDVIERCLNSVFKQNHIAEVIICDDCSTDRTLEIARKFPVTIFQNEVNTGGPNEGRNIGILNAYTDYIAFLDQDDEWDFDKIENDLILIKFYGCDLVYSQYKGNEKIPSPDIYKTLLKRDKSYGWVYPSSIVMKNENVPLFETCFGQLDYGWLLQVTSNRKCRQVLPKVIRHKTGNNLSLNPNYRRNDFYMGLLEVDGDIDTMKSWYSSRARYHYYMHEMKLARFYFLRGKIGWKEVLYYLTSYSYNLSKFINKKFKVFG